MPWRAPLPGTGLGFSLSDCGVCTPSYLHSDHCSWSFKIRFGKRRGCRAGTSCGLEHRSPSRLRFPQKEAAEKRSTDTCSLEQSSICLFQWRCTNSSVPGAGEECGSTRSAQDAKLRQPLSKASQHRQVSGPSEHLPADIKANKRQSRAQPNIYTGCCHATECSLARQGFL